MTSIRMATVVVVVVVGLIVIIGVVTWAATDRFN